MKVVKTIVDDEMYSQLEKIRRERGIRAMAELIRMLLKEAISLNTKREVISGVISN